MAAETIQLEAFGTALHGARILLQGPFPSHRLPPIMEYVTALRDPFKKKILVRGSSSMHFMSKYLPLPYDATFQAKETIDWQLVLAYTTYAPRPSLLVMEEIATVPDGFWSKLPKGITVLHIVSTRTVVQLRPYDAIFFAPIEEIQTSFAEYTYKMLHAVYRSSYTMQEHKEILNELRVAQAGVAWTNINESRQGGALYWYDIADASSTERVSSNELRDLFEWLVTHV